MVSRLKEACTGAKTVDALNVDALTVDALSVDALVVEALIVGLALASVVDGGVGACVVVGIVIGPPSKHRTQ